MLRHSGAGQSGVQPQCTVSCEVAQEVTVSQYMGHQDIGDTNPAAGAFGRLSEHNAKNFLSKKVLLDQLNELTKAPLIWAKGQIPQQNKDLMPAHARLARLP